MEQHIETTTREKSRFRIFGSGRFCTRVVHGDEGREATRHVRHQVYCVEKGYLQPGNLFDHYDERATIVNCFQGDEAVGTMRITDSSEGELEIFEMHPELRAMVPAGARLLEVSRLMVVPAVRGGLKATVPMFKHALDQLVQRDAQGIIISCAASLIRYYRDLIGFRQLSQEPLHHARLQGLSDYPMVFDWPDVLAQATPTRLAAWTAINPMWALRAVKATAARALTDRDAADADAELGRAA